MYSRGQSPREYIKLRKGTNPIHPSEATVQLTCTIVSISVNMPSKLPLRVYLHGVSLSKPHIVALSGRPSSRRCLFVCLMSV